MSNFSSCFMIVIMISLLIKENNASENLKTSEIRNTDDCFSIPDGSVDWDIQQFNSGKSLTHAIPTRPKCLKPSDVNRKQKAAVVSIYSPNFSEFSRTAYRVDKISLRTVCYTNFIGNKEMRVASRNRVLLNDNDILLLNFLCKNTTCNHELTRLILGESIIYPKPEEYECTWLSEKETINTRYIISTISLQFNSTGHLLFPILGTNCNVLNTTSCVQRSKTFMILFPQINIDPCAIKLKLIAPGIVSWTDNKIEVDNKTYISVPDSHMTFWFKNDFLTEPTRCIIDDVFVKESSDGYLIGLSSESKPNMNYKNETVNLVSDKFLGYSHITNNSNRFNPLLKPSEKTNKKNPLYENLQRSYSRAELQWGLTQLHNDIDSLRNDVSYEICKLKASNWDLAFTNLYNNPDLMAKFIYPLDSVKGIFKDNLLFVSFGEQKFGLCIPRKFEFEGYYLKLNIKGQPYWLRASTGELLRTSPEIHQTIRIASFVVPLLPDGFFDVMDQRVTKESINSYTSLSNPSQYLFSSPELLDIHELLSWDSDFQRYEARLMNEMSIKTKDNMDLNASFDEYIVEPVKNTWNYFSQGTRNIIRWTILFFVGFIILYFFANIIIPVIKLRYKNQYSSRKILLKQRKVDMEASKLTSF